MPWPPRRSSIDALKLERENDHLRTQICCLRRELENREGAVGPPRTAAAWAPNQDRWTECHEFDRL